VVIAWGVLALAGSAAETSQSLRDEQTLRDARMAADGPALVEFFRKRTIKDVDPTQLKLLVRQLGDDSFEVREKASAQLVQLGATAVPYLKEALKDPDVEIVRRAEDCLKRVGEGSTGALVDAAARLLAARKPEGAAEALLGYLPFAEDDVAADEVRSALAALALRDGKLEPILVQALADKVAARRAAAAVALLRTGLAAAPPLVEKLLQDTDAQVRLQVGLALATARDKKAIPVLIDLLADAPPAQLGPVQDLLHRLAAEQAPTAAPGSDAAGRRKYRDAWADWWTKHGGAIDLAKLEQPVKPLGYTMLVLLDEGKILELNEKKEKRWEIGGLQFPLDAQYLPGDRILIAEQAGNRVTERNTKGEILWQKQVSDPLVAQRLPTGNTFIANRTQILEVDRDGKEVFTWAPRNGELVMRAQRLPSGEVATILSAPDRNTSRFVRLDPTGAAELQSYPVEVHTFGGRFDVLPNRRVLIPQMRNSRVVEHDARGKIVWEMPAEQPIVAVRLADGHTLVTSMTQQRAVEMDAKGKEVWDFKGTTRVTRAWRR
jgi:hypothetical protein